MLCFSAFMLELNSINYQKPKTCCFHYVKNFRLLLLLLKLLFLRDKEKAISIKTKPLILPMVDMGSFI